jgi:hypothetical protein
VVVLEHVGRLQILMIDGVVLLHKVKRRLVVKVDPLALYREVRFGEQLRRFPAAVTPLLAARHSALRGFEAALCLTVTAGIVDHRAIREGGEGF